MPPMMPPTKNVPCWMLCQVSLESARPSRTNWARITRTMATTIATIGSTRLLLVPVDACVVMWLKPSSDREVEGTHLAVGSRGHVVLAPGELDVVSVVEVARALVQALHGDDGHGLGLPG